jgi:hypothetical protein
MNQRESWLLRFRKSPAHTQTNIVCSAIIALATVAYVCVAAIQLIVMRGTLAEMKRSGEQSTAQMWSAIGNVNWMARSMDWNQKVGQQSIESSGRQSKHVLDASIASSRLDQRAWLGAGDNTYSITESGPIHSSVSVINTGRTPAIEIYCRITGTTKIRGEILHRSDITYSPELPTLKEGAIFPNVHFPLVAGGISMDPAKQKVWSENVQSGSWIAYFFGEIRYKDIFGENHWTHFCSSYVPETKSGTPCAIYNETDDQKANNKQTR